MSKIKYDKAQVGSVFTNNPKENAIIITSDGNVFLEKHESYAKSHCKEFKQEFETLTRAEFEGGKSADKTPGKSSTPTADKDWRLGKFGEIVEFAKTKGLEAKTRTNQGKPALVAEVEAFLATLTPEADDSKGSDEGAGDGENPEGGDYKVVGAEGTQD